MTRNDAPGPLDSGGRHLPAGRRATIIAAVEENRELTVAQLAERCGVSVATIRRDLQELDSEGVLIRTHGGAVSPRGMPAPDSAFELRRRVQTDAKIAIGRLAAELIPSGSSVVINGGTTTLAMTPFLQSHRDLTITTNNLVLPIELPEACYRAVHVLGGTLRARAQATIGPVALATASGASTVRLRFDVGIIGVGGITSDGGFHSASAAEAASIQEMMDRSATVVVVADSSKFDRALLAELAPLDAADVLVTDAAPPEPLAAALRDAGVRVITPVADA